MVIPASTNAHIKCVKQQIISKPRNLVNIFSLQQSTACVALKDLMQSVASDL